MNIHTNSQYGILLLKNSQAEYSSEALLVDDVAFDKFETIEVYNDIIAILGDGWGIGEFHIIASINFKKPSNAIDMLQFLLDTSSGILELCDDDNNTYFKIPVSNKTLVYINHISDINTVEIFIER